MAMYCIKFWKLYTNILGIVSNFKKLKLSGRSITPSPYSHIHLHEQFSTYTPPPSDWTTGKRRREEAQQGVQLQAVGLPEKLLRVLRGQDPVHGRVQVPRLQKCRGGDGAEEGAEGPAARRDEAQPQGQARAEHQRPAPCRSCGRRAGDEVSSYFAQLQGD